MKALRCLLLGVAGLLLAGCYSVTVPHPFGLEPVYLAPEDWNGVWLLEDGAVSVEVKDAAGGVLSAASVKFQDGSATLTTMLLHVRSAGRSEFISTEDQDHKGGQGTRYVWALMKRDKNQLVIWIPDVNAFKIAVQSGAMPGTMDGDNVWLETLGPDQYKQITNEKKNLFSWESPVVFQRHSR